MSWRELVGLKPDVIVAATDGAVAVVKRKTRAIPIVMAPVPIRSGPNSW